MRKIERDMMQAIHQRRNWSGGGQSRVEPNRHQTEVVQDPATNAADIYLHGTCIAMWSYNQDKALLNEQALQDYPTRTTCSRMNALGIGAHIENGVPHVDGEPV